MAALGYHVPDFGPIYGHETAYTVGGFVGTGVGIVGSFAIGNVASGASSLVACGSALQTAAKIYTTANTVIGFGAGAYHISQGKGTFSDYVSVASGAASAIGWVGGKLSGVRNCFVAGTEVLVGSAASPGVFSEKEIQDIRAGDEVWTKDQNNPNAPLELKTVKQVFIHTAYDLQKVSVTDESTGNVETYDVTDEHPFYVQNVGWTSARELVIGQHLQGSHGQILTVTANVDDQRPDGVTVYNFEVEGDHTYFVADGQGTTDEFVWVHNACSITSGENTYASLGRMKHEEFTAVAKTQGYITKTRLPSGKIPDAFKIIYEDGKAVGVILRELKPDNTRAVSRGLNQLNEYARELSTMRFGGRKIPLENIIQILETYHR